MSLFKKLSAIAINHMVASIMKLLRCDYGEFIQQQVIGPIIWPFFDLLVIHQGQIEIIIADGTQFSLTQGEAVLIYPNTHFSGKGLSEKSLASVQHFSLSSQDDDFSISHLSPLMPLSNGARSYSLDSLVIADIERSLTYNQTLLPADYVEQIQVALLHLILTQLNYQKANAFPNSKFKIPFSQLIDSFLARPHQSINIENMAAKVNISLSHFRAEFFKIYGEPPVRYLLSLRIKLACQLLVQGQLPIKSISATLGYQDTSYFYRHFQKIMKTTPSLYRKQRQIVG